MTEQNVQARIHSLNGELAQVKMIGKPDEHKNQYIVEYRGVKCTAIYNPFMCCYYADDIYGVVDDETAIRMMKEGR